MKNTLIKPQSFGFRPENALYGEEPKPDWISFEDREPEEGQQIYTEDSIDPKKLIDEKPYSWGYRFEDVLGAKYWTDATEHDQRLQQWKEHEKVYDNWQILSNGNKFVHPTQKVKIYFNWGIRKQFIISKMIEDEHGKVWQNIYEGETPSHQELQLICNRNGIEL